MKFMFSSVYRVTQKDFYARPYTSMWAPVVARQISGWFDTTYHWSSSAYNTSHADKHVASAWISFRYLSSYNRCPHWSVRTCIKHNHVFLYTSSTDTLYITTISLCNLHCYMFRHFPVTIRHFTSKASLSYSRQTSTIETSTNGLYIQQQTHTDCTTDCNTEKCYCILLQKIQYFNILQIS